MLDVCLLGTGGMMPLPYRKLTACMTRFNGHSLLIDQMCIRDRHNAVKKSSKCYLMMESHKFDFKANYVYATFDDVDGVICEDGLSKEIQDKLETYQTKII